ncbi:MAG: cobyrinate a,c-diamide synthase, partial [Spirochaetota bacterium]|nr:cobyrinate a,c-diamide synthase [Spirochaetota bacterium]
MLIPRITLSAPARSSGKTTVTLGLTRALSQDGLQIQPFKKGPDYIDPMWLSAASGRLCRNLDHYLMGEDHIKSSFQRHSADCDMAIIEGNMGLHDSMDLSGTGSTAHLAGLLKSPVILIIDCHGLNRGIAPLVMGYQQFDPDVPIRAVILNRVRGSRHENKLKAALEHYTGVEVIGAIPTDKRIEITERHLGLVPVDENLDVTPVLSVLEGVIRDYVSINRLVEL